jgi:hypothetical protein
VFILPLSKFSIGSRCPGIGESVTASVPEGPGIGCQYERPYC